METRRAERLMSITEIAEAVGWTKARILRHIKKGNIKAKKYGWNWMVTVSSYNDFVKTYIMKG